MENKRKPGRPSGPSVPSESRESLIAAGSFVPPNTVFIPGAVIDGRWRPDMIQASCARCGKNFERNAKEYKKYFRTYGKANATTYCSDACRRNPATFKCPQCGGRKASMAATCKVCYLKDKHVHLTCKNCGKDVRRTKSEQNKNVKTYGDTGNAFCDRACYLDYKTAHPLEKTIPVGACLTCGKLVHGNKKFCCMACYLATRRKPEAAERPYTGRWNQERHRTKKRFNGVCAMCGRVKDRVQVHHVDHDATNHSKNNLVLLCEPCHGLYHQTFTGTVRETLKEYFQALATGS